MGIRWSVIELVNEDLVLILRPMVNVGVKLLGVGVPIIQAGGLVLVSVEVGIADSF